MDEENGLDLGLGLSCGDSSSKSVTKNAGTLIIPTDDGDKGNGVLEGFKSFIQAANEKQDADVENQPDDIAKSQGNFFEKLSMAANNKRTNDHEDGLVSYTPNNRKLIFNELNDQKMHESEVQHAGPQDREKKSHISITTDDGSTAENEDVAESEVECSTSMLITNHVTTSMNVIEAEGTKSLNPASKHESLIGSMNYNAPYAVRPTSIMNTPSYPLQSIVQMLPPANGERPVTSPNSQMEFRYSPAQLPILTRDHTWGMLTRLQQPNPSNVGRIADNTGIASERQINDMQKCQVSGQVPPAGLSEATHESGSKRSRDDIRKVAGEDDGSNRTTIKFKDRAAAAQSTSGVPHVGSVIRPGIAADVKFGGSGSHPNLPWVSTTGSGTNGRTISGVTYRFSPNQIKIVCACHGSHMTPEEFVRHASDEHSNPNTSGGIGVFPNDNPAASAQS
uniref:Ninja-family protein n=1 Tax=Kalanchoe fedtschenkoi TaxID=63787 RepID=A0A7N0TI56_KALFE